MNMKQVLSFAVFLLAISLSVTAFAQLADRPVPVVLPEGGPKLEAVDVGMLKRNDHVPTIDIIVRSEGKIAGRVEYMWIGRAGPAGGKNYVVQTQSAKVWTRGADQSARCVGGYMRRERGLRYEGWIAVLYSADNVPLAVKASSPELEKDFLSGRAAKYERWGAVE